MTPSNTLSFALVSGMLAASLAAACGGGGADPNVPPNPIPSASASDTTPPPTPSATTPGTASTTPPTHPSASTTPPGPTAPAFAGPMKPLIATALIAELKAIEIDAKNLPTMDKLEPKKLRAVMPILAKALGAKCNDCHVEADFKADTRRKNIAKKMWDEFARTLTMKDGSPLFCDSCHQGRMLQLDRKDKKALSEWMDQNFVAKLKQKNNSPHGCESSQCHKDQDYQPLKKWAGGLP